MAVVQDFVADQFVITRMVGGETTVQRLPPGDYQAYIRTLAETYLITRETHRDAVADLVSVIRLHGGNMNAVLPTDSLAQVAAKREQALSLVASAGTWVLPALLRSAGNDFVHHGNLETRDTHLNAPGGIQKAAEDEVSARVEFEAAASELADALHQTTWRILYDVNGKDIAVRQSAVGGVEIIDGYVAGQELPR